MTSKPVLDLDELLKPLPAGKPLPDDVRIELDANRREPVPGDSTTSHWKADWPKVLRLTTGVLTGTGKDLHAAARLVEAATKVHGAPGLRDGLVLLKRLISECWDRLYPVPEDGETTDVREGPIVSLNVNGRNMAMPQTILGIPLFRTQKDAFTPIDLWDKERKAALDEAVAATKTEKLEPLRTTHADLLAARQALADLSAALTERRLDKNEAPDYTSPDKPSNLGGAIEKCIEMVEQIAHTRGFPLVPVSATAAAAQPADGESASESAATAAPATNREGLYRQIEQIAATLRRVEPHSPIPFLLERCVRLGRLPFPELMRAMLGGNAAVDELDKLLGIEKKE